MLGAHLQPPQCSLSCKLMILIELLPLRNEEALQPCLATAGYFHPVALENKLQRRQLVPANSRKLEHCTSLDPADPAGQMANLGSPLTREFRRCCHRIDQSFAGH